MKDEEIEHQLSAELAAAVKKNEYLQSLFNQVEAAKKQWENTVDCIDDMVFVADSNGRVLRCNKSVTIFTGKAYCDIIGKDWQEVLLEHGIKIVAGSGDLKKTEVFHEPTGRWFVASYFAFRDPRYDESSGCAITLHDITETKTLAESLDITNTTLDNDRRELQFALEEISFLLREVEKENDLSLRFGNLGTYVSDPIYQIGERFNGMMEMLQVGHMELEKTNKELSELNLLKNKFLGIAAHDLRNPLSSINGLTEVLLTNVFGPLTDEQKEYLTIINTTSNEMLFLVNDLLDIAVIESGKIELDVQPHSLTKLLLDRIRLSSVIAEKKGIVISHETGDLPEVSFDLKRIAQVIDNLIGNAIKFSPAGSGI
ncbi:MAG TPA: histidine kinase dimerization/phospho-acceptor domain-containing protein, partial [Dissulfurispiraceae bacterium]|nr:histidine kinase dimerization/phospho-acceptor domain-containing protein [Dissulfurispiraceae bacterium]